MLSNSYNLYKKKSIFTKYGLGIVILFLIGIIYLYDIRFESTLKIEGIYTCPKTCLIKTQLPLNEIKKLNTKSKIKIKENFMPLKIKEFGKIEIYENKISVQEVNIEIPKQEFYEKQMVEVEILKEQENIYQIIYKALKGGDI